MNCKTGCSAVRLAHLLWEQGVPGSNPGTPTQKKEVNIFSFLFSFISNTFFTPDLGSVQKVCKFLISISILIIKSKHFKLAFIMIYNSIYIKISITQIRKIPSKFFIKLFFESISHILNISMI